MLISKSFARDRNGDVYIGTTDGIGKYDGYDDNNSSYVFRYSSPGLTFGDPSKIKFLKRYGPLLLAATVQTLFLVGRMTFRFRPIRHGLGGYVDAGFYGESEYTAVEFSLGDLISRKSLNCTGNGSVVSVGLQTEVNGNSISLQEMNVLALIGKTV